MICTTVEPHRAPLSFALLHIELAHTVCGEPVRLSDEQRTVKYCVHFDSSSTAIH